MLDDINSAIYDKIKDSGKITFLLKDLTEKLKIKDFRYSKDIFTHLSIPESKYNYKIIQEFLMKYPQKFFENIKDIKGFIIIIDEFQFLKKLKNQESFFCLLQSYAQFQSRVSYVLCGSISQSSDIVQMLNGESGAFGGSMLQINIEPFTKRENKSYFNERFPEIKFSEDGFMRFYEYTKGIPLYISSFYNSLSCYEIYDEELIDFIFLNNMDQILVMWIKVWITLNKFEKKILIAMLRKDNISWSNLKKNLDMSPATLTKYIRALQVKNIIKKCDGEYSFEDLMFKTWLSHEEYPF